MTYRWKTDPTIAELACFDTSDTSVVMGALLTTPKVTDYFRQTVSEYVAAVPPAVLALATSDQGTWVSPAPTPR